MPVAVADFECIYHGKRTLLKAGLNRVDERHEIYLRHPDKFAPDGLGALARRPPRRRAERSLATARTTPARSAARSWLVDVEPPQISKTWPPRTVTFTATAHEQLRAAHFTSDHESAFALYGQAEGASLTVRDLL